MESEIMSQSLQTKLVTLVHYCEMERCNSLNRNAHAVRNRLLDDIEVAQWADQHKYDLLYSVRAIR